MARNEEEYDWLNDPFDEKKAAEEKAGMSKGSKRAILIALLVIVVVLIVFAMVSVSGIAALMML